MHHGLRGGWTPPCGTGHFWPALYLQMRRPVYARPISSLPHSVNSCVRSSVKSLFKVPAGPYYYTCTQSGFHAPPAEKQRRQAVEYYNIEVMKLKYSNVKRDCRIRALHRRHYCIQKSAAEARRGVHGRP